MASNSISSVQEALEEEEKEAVAMATTDLASPQTVVTDEDQGGPPVQVVNSDGGDGGGGGPVTAAVDTNNNSVLIETINTKLNDLKLNVKGLNSRCDQFNDVKQSIRQMNDLIKEDLFMDFGSIALLLRTRLDEMCDKIKERLKDAYSVVRDTQAKLVSKLGELKQELEELEKLKEQCSQPPSQLQTTATDQGYDQETPTTVAEDSGAVQQQHAKKTTTTTTTTTVEQIEQKIKFARDQIDLINNELYFLICGGSEPRLGGGDDPSSSTSQSATNQILALRGSNSDSLLVENHLYPQFNYYIDTNRLVNEINNLYVQLGPSNNVNPKVYFFDDPLNENYLNARVASAGKPSDSVDDAPPTDKAGQGKEREEEEQEQEEEEDKTPTPPPPPPLQAPPHCIIRNNTFDCVVNSSLSADGSFWIQLIGSSSAPNAAAAGADVLPDAHRIKRKQQKLNLFIEELNKYVRQKRIGDKEWRTYAEAIELGLHTPAVNEKCFCLEPRSRKWLRARLLKFDLAKQTCHVRFMDTGHVVLDDSITFGHLLLWKDFDLSKMPARVIKCVLLVEEPTDEAETATATAEKSYEKDICLETRFLFRDLTAKKYLKCTVLEPVASTKDEAAPGSLSLTSTGVEEEDTWYVRLHYSKDKTVNHLIHEINENEKKILAGKDGAANANFRSLDIRMENGGGEGMQMTTKIIKMNAVSSMPSVAMVTATAEQTATAAGAAVVVQTPDTAASADEQASSLAVGTAEDQKSEACSSLPVQHTATEKEEDSDVSLKQQAPAVDTTTVDIEKPSLTESSLNCNDDNSQRAEANHDHNTFTNVTHNHHQTPAFYDAAARSSGQASSFSSNRFNQQRSINQQQQQQRPNNNCRNRNRQNGQHQFTTDFRDTNFSLPPQRHQESFDQQRQQQTVSLLGEYQHHQSHQQTFVGNQLHGWPDQSARFHSSQPNVSSQQSANTTDRGSLQPPSDSDRKQGRNAAGKGASQSRRRSPPNRRDRSPTNQQQPYSNPSNNNQFSQLLAAKRSQQPQTATNSVEQQPQPSPTVSGPHNTWHGPSAYGGGMRSDNPGEMGAAGGSRSLVQGGSPNNRNDRNRSNRRTTQNGGNNNTGPDTGASRSTPDGSVDNRSGGNRNSNNRPRGGGGGGGGAPGAGACKNEGNRGGQGYHRRDNGDDDDNYRPGGDQRRGGGGGGGRANSGFRSGGGGGGPRNNDYHNSSKYSGGNKNTPSNQRAATMLDDFENHKRSYSSASTSLSSLLAVNQFHLNKKTKAPRKETLIKQATSKLMAGAAGPYVVMCGADEEQSSSAFNDVFIDSDSMYNLNANLGGRSSDRTTESGCDQDDEDEDEDDDEDDDQFDPFRDPGGGVGLRQLAVRDDYYEDQDADNECDCDDCRFSGMFDQDGRRVLVLDNDNSSTYVSVRVKKDTFTGSCSVARTRVRARSCCEEFLFVRRHEAVIDSSSSPCQNESLADSARPTPGGVDEVERSSALTTANTATSSSSAVLKPPRRKRNRDKSYSNDYFCLYYNAQERQEDEEEEDDEATAAAKKSSEQPQPSQNSSRSIEKSRNRYDCHDSEAALKSRDVDQVEKESSKQGSQKVSGLNDELNDEENQQCCLDKLKSLQSTQSELSLNDKAKFEDDDEEEYLIGGKKKSLLDDDDWDDGDALFPGGGANSYARMRQECCTTRSTTTTEQILSNLAKVELSADGQDQDGDGGDGNHGNHGNREEDGDGDGQQHSMEKKMCEENTTSMDTTSDLNALEVTLDITHPVACRHASQLPLDGGGGGQPQSPVARCDDQQQRLSRFRNRPPGGSTLFTLHSTAAAKPRSFSANAAVSGNANANSWSVDLLRRAEQHQKQLIKDEDPAEPRTEPVIASAAAAERAQGEEDESFESCAEELIFLRTSTTASSGHNTSSGDDDDCGMKPKAAKKSKMAAEDDTDASLDDEHDDDAASAAGQAVVKTSADQSPNSTASRPDDGVKNSSFKSNKTHETSSLNTIDPILVEDDHQPAAATDDHQWLLSAAANESKDDSFQEVREDDRLTITAGKLSQSSLQGAADEPPQVTTLTTPQEQEQEKPATETKNSLLVNSKVERLKKFTMAVFVDSFEDYSLNKTSSSSASSSSASSSNTTNGDTKAVASASAGGGTGNNRDDTAPSNAFGPDLLNSSGANLNNTTTTSLTGVQVNGNMASMGGASNTSSTLNSSLILVNTSTSLTQQHVVNNISVNRPNNQTNESTLAEGFVTAASINATVESSLSSSTNPLLNSLREFEMNEAKIKALGSDYGLSSQHSDNSRRGGQTTATAAASSKLKGSNSSNLMLDEDDVFMFQSHPNMFTSSTPTKSTAVKAEDTAVAAKPVTSKPPALISNVVVYSSSNTATAGTPPVHRAMNIASGSSSQQQLNHHSYYFNNDETSSTDRPQSTASASNGAAQAAVANYGYLSTITEYSNETYETCSNQSSNVNLKNRPTHGAALQPRHSASSNSTATSLTTNQNATVISAAETVVHAVPAMVVGGQRSQHSDDQKAASVASSVTTVKKFGSYVDPDDQQLGQDAAFDHLDDSKVTLRRKASSRAAAVVKDTSSSTSRSAGGQDDQQQHHHQHYDGGTPTHEYQQLVNRKVNSWLRVCGDSSSNVEENSRERQMQLLTKSDISVYDITVGNDEEVGGGQQLNLDLLTSSASVTDKLFERFAMIANDEIMNEADYSVTASSSMLVASNPPRGPTVHKTVVVTGEDLANQSSSSSASFKTSLSQIKDDSAVVKVMDYRTYLKNQSSTTLIGGSGNDESSSSSAADSSSDISSSITLSSLNNRQQPAEDNHLQVAAPPKPNRHRVIDQNNIYLESGSIPVDGLFSAVGVGEGEGEENDDDDVFLKQDETPKLPSADKTKSKVKAAVVVKDADGQGEGSSTSISLSIEASKSESDLMALDFTPASQQALEPHHRHHNQRHNHQLNEQGTSSPSPLDHVDDESCWCFNANCAAAMLNSTLSSNGGHQNNNLSPHQSRQHKHSGHHHHRHHHHHHHHRAHRSLSRGANSLLNNAYYNQLVSSASLANNNGSVTPVQTPVQQLSASSPFTPTGLGGPSHNLSTATTIEISSLTSDSLFNSHLIITPMCSDAGFSPSTVTQLGSILLAKSPLMPPISPANGANSSPLQSTSLSNLLFKQQQHTSRHQLTATETAGTATVRPQGAISANNMNLIAQLTASISGLAAARSLSSNSSSTGVTAVPAATAGLHHSLTSNRPVSPPLPPPAEPASQNNGESLSLSLPPPPPPISDSNETSSDSRREFQLVLRSFKNRSTSSPPTARESNSALSNSSNNTVRAVRTPPSAVIAKIIESLSLQAHNGCGPISNLFAQQHHHHHQVSLRSHSAAPSVKPSSLIKVDTSSEKVSTDQLANSSILSLPPPPSPHSLEVVTGGLHTVPDGDGQQATPPVSSEKNSLLSSNDQEIGVSVEHASNSSGGQVVEEQLVAPSKLSGNKKNLVEVLAARLNLTERSLANSPPIAANSTCSPPVVAAAPRASSASGRSVFTSSSNNSLSSSQGGATSQDSVKPSHRYIAPPPDVNVARAASAAFKKNQDIFNKLDELNKKKLAKLSRESSVSSFLGDEKATEKPVVAGNQEVVTKNAVAKLIRDLAASNSTGTGLTVPAASSQIGRSAQRWTSAHFNSLYGLDSDDEKEQSGNNGANNLASIANEAKRQRRCNSTNSAIECGGGESLLAKPPVEPEESQAPAAKVRSESISSTSSGCSLPLPTPPPLLELQDHQFQFGGSSAAPMNNNNSNNQRQQTDQIYSTPTDVVVSAKSREQHAPDAILTPPPSTKIDIKESVRRYTNAIIEKHRPLGSAAADQQSPSLTDTDSGQAVKTEPPAVASTPTIKVKAPSSKMAAAAPSNNVQMLVNFIYNNNNNNNNSPVGQQRSSPEVAVENSKPKMAAASLTTHPLLLRSLSGGHRESSADEAARQQQQPTRLATHHLPSQLIQERLNDLVSNHGKHEVSRSDRSPPIRTDHSQHAFVRPSVTQAAGQIPTGRCNNNDRSTVFTFPVAMEETRNRCHENSTSERHYNPGSNESSFKLDHLININPKKLSKNSKFRCRIHDLINEHGQFWIEVVYSPPDERKFTELAKLLRVCSNISQPPKDIQVGKRVSAWYKNEWHRAIILEIMEPAEQINSTVKVRFIDMGITKTLKRYQDIREVDDKFFQSPLKSLYCTIDLMGDMKLNREARKHFTRLIYKKMLYVKLVDSKTTTTTNVAATRAAHSPGYSHYSATTSRTDYLNDSSATTTFASIPPPPPYKVVLGCPTQHGVINAYMYLLSKFNRPTYEHLKQQQQQLEGGQERQASIAAESTRNTGQQNQRWSQSSKTLYQSMLPPMPACHASLASSPSSHTFPPPPPTLHQFVGSPGNMLPPPSPPRNPPPSPPSYAPNLPPRPSPVSGSNLFGGGTAYSSNLYRPVPVNLSKIFGWMSSEPTNQDQDQDQETLNGGEAFSDIYDKINSVSQVNYHPARQQYNPPPPAIHDDLLLNREETERDDDNDDDDDDGDNNVDEFYETRQAAEDAMFYDFDDTTTSDSDYLFSDILNLTENSRIETATHSEAGLFSSRHDPLSSRTANYPGHNNNEEATYAELDLRKLGLNSTSFAPVNSMQSSVTERSYAPPAVPYNSIYFSPNHRANNSLSQHGQGGQCNHSNESMVDDDGGLDMTPVKEDENQSYCPNSTTLNNTTFNRLANNSTFVSSERRRGTLLVGGGGGGGGDQDSTCKLLANATSSILLPPSLSLSPFQLRKYMESKQQVPPPNEVSESRANISYNSDTDTSSQHAPCCPIPKFKKPTVPASNRLKLLHNYRFEDRSYESYSQRQSMQSIKDNSAQPTEFNKKVKFHLN